MDAAPRPPHGLQGMDTSADVPFITIGLCILLLVTIIFVVRLLLQWRRKNKQVLQEPTRLDRLEKLRRQVNDKRNSVDRLSKNDISFMSLSLRTAISLLIDRPLRDLTQEEVKEILPSHWPLTKSYGDFLALLQSLDRIKYQNLGHFDPK